MNVGHRKGSGFGATLPCVCVFGGMGIICAVPLSNLQHPRAMGRQLMFFTPWFLTIIAQDASCGLQVSHGGRGEAQIFLSGLSKGIRQRNILTGSGQGHDSVLSLQGLSRVGLTALFVAPIGPLLPQP